MKTMEEITEAIRQLLREENKNVSNLIMRPPAQGQEEAHQSEINKKYSDIYRLEAAHTVLTIK